MADPGQTDEAVIDAKATTGPVHVGSVAPLGFFTNAQLTAPRVRQPSGQAAPDRHREGRRQVVYSSEEDPGRRRRPARRRRAVHPRADPAARPVLRQLHRDRRPARPPDQRGRRRGQPSSSVLPKGFPIEFYVTSLTAAKAERAIEPTSIALAVFGGIAAVAALLIAGQVIGRQLRLGAARPRNAARARCEPGRDHWRRAARGARRHRGGRAARRRRRRRPVAARAARLRSATSTRIKASRSTGPSSAQASRCSPACWPRPRP